MRRVAALPLLLAAASLVASASVDQGLLALVPAGSKFIAGVDVDRAKSSQLWQYVAGKAHSDNKEFTDFVQQTGFDPRRDLQQLVLAGSAPMAGPGHSDAKFAVFARGNFDQLRLDASAKQKGFVAQNVEGVELFVDKSQAKGGNAFAFLGNGIVVVGDPQSVKQIISNRAGGASTLDAAIQARVTKTAAENDIWFVSFVSGSEIATHFNPVPVDGAEKNQSANQGWPQAQALQSVQEASGGIQLGDMIRFTFDAVTRSAKDATSLADVVRFFASMVQMQRQKDPRAEMAAAAFDDMQLRTDGDAVHVSLAFPEKTLEKLADSAAPAMGGNVQVTPNKQ
jgi:hypothetical protein